MSQDLTQSISDLSLEINSNQENRSNIQSPSPTSQVSRLTNSDELDTDFGPAAQTSEYTPEQIAQVYDEDQKKQVKLLINKAFTLCESAVQDYIVAVSEKDHEFWGFTKIPTPFIEFKNNLDPSLSIKLGMAVVDKEHMFPPDKCRPKAIKNEMVFMLNGLNIVLPHILNAYRIENPDPTAISIFEQVRPKYFNKNSKFMTDPNNLTACMYCGENEEFEKLRGRKPNADESKAIYRLNHHQKRIGFILGDSNTSSLGQVGHNDVSENYVNDFGKAMTARNIVTKPDVEPKK